MSEVSGLVLVEQYLEEEREQELLAIIDGQPWLSELSRRVQHHGWRYDYKGRKVTPEMCLGPSPGWLQKLAEELRERRLMLWISCKFRGRPSSFRRGRIVHRGRPHMRAAKIEYKSGGQWSVRRRPALIVFLFLASFVAGLMLVPARREAFVPTPAEPVPELPRHTRSADADAAKPALKPATTTRAAAPVKVPPAPELFVNMGSVRLVAERLRQADVPITEDYLKDIPELTLPDKNSSWASQRSSLRRERVSDFGENQEALAAAMHLRGAEVEYARRYLQQRLISPAIYARLLKQVMLAGNKAGCLQGVRELKRLQHAQATAALAEFALYSPWAATRAEAVRELARRPAASYRQLLLDGLRYPWPPSADRAAQALVYLGDTSCIPALRKLQELPDPAAPFFHAPSGGHYVRELVCVSHINACALCHEPTKNKLAPLAMPIPEWPDDGGYYMRQMLRDNITLHQWIDANVALVRQDFSVTFPVKLRYDYLLRTRPATPLEVAQARATALYPQRQAVDFALYHLLRQASKQPDSGAIVPTNEQGKADEAAPSR